MAKKRRYVGILILPDEGGGRVLTQMAHNIEVRLIPIISFSEKAAAKGKELAELEPLTVFIKSITARKDGGLDIKFKVAEVHECIRSGEHTLRFDESLLCQKLPKDFFVDPKDL